MFKMKPKVHLRSGREEMISEIRVQEGLVNSETYMTTENQNRIHSTQMGYTFQIKYLKTDQKPIFKMGNCEI